MGAEGLAQLTQVRGSAIEPPRREFDVGISSSVIELYIKAAAAVRRGL